MTQHYGPLNNTKPATFALGLWNLLQAWLAAGWTIKASGDGLAAYSASGSVFTNGGASGANGFDNSGAWLRIAMPGTMSGREFCIVRGSTAGYYAIALSPLDKFANGGSATVAPSAADQQFILGSALTTVGAQPLQSGTVGQNYYNSMADDAAPYNFYLFGFPQGNGTDNCYFVSDYLTSLSAGTGGTDPDPYIYAAGTSSFLNSATPASKGFANSYWGSHALNGPSSSASGTSTGNPYEQGHDLVPAMCFTTGVNNSADYFRGYTQQLLYDFHSNTTVNHSALNSGATKILVGQMALPWDGSAIITA